MNRTQRTCSRVAVVALLLTLVLTPLQLWAGLFSELVVFGDSLSDVGNFSSEQPLLPPSPPYAEGRFSNGSVWVEHLAELLNTPPVTASEQGGTNWAWAGATTGSVSWPDSQVRNMDTQVNDYLEGNTPRHDQLFVLWGGVNDFNLGQTDVSLPVQLLSSQVSQLIAAGARKILVVNVPAFLGPNEYPLADSFNDLLREALADISSSDENLTIVHMDFAGLLDSVLADPAAFGFSEIVASACADCGVGLTLGPNDIASQPEEYFFWDNTHPSAIAHQLIGNAAFAEVARELLALGDMNLDGSVNGLDIDPFVEVLLNNVFQAEADMNLDAAVNGLDVESFVAAVVGGSAQEIPEPSTLVLCIVALSVLGGWRKWGG